MLADNMHTSCQRVPRPVVHIFASADTQIHAARCACTNDERGHESFTKKHTHTHTYTSVHRNIQTEQRLPPKPTVQDGQASKRMDKQTDADDIPWEGIQGHAPPQTSVHAYVGMDVSAQLSNSCQLAASCLSVDLLTFP